MKKIINSWNFGIHFIFSLVLTFIVGIAVRFVITRHTAASIGIIGSADGPTTIFISNKVAGIFLPSLIYVAMFIVLLAIYIPIKTIVRRKREQ